MYVIASILIVSIVITESLSGFSFIKPEPFSYGIAAITSGNKNQSNDLVIVIPSEPKIRKKAAQPDTTKKPTKNDAVQDDEKFVTPPLFSGTSNPQESNLAYSKFVRMNVVYPQELYNSGKKGDVFIRYSIDESGKVYNLIVGNEEMRKFYNEQIEKSKDNPAEVEKYKKRLDKIIDDPLLIKEAQRLVMSMPPYTPAKNKSGKAVKAEHNMCNIYFQDPKSRTSNDLFNEYIKYNLKYPEEAKAKGIEGTVYLKYDLDKEGHYGNIKLKDMRTFLKERNDTARLNAISEHPLLVAEAMRLLKERPGYYIEKFDSTTRAAVGMCNIDFFLPK